MDVKPLIHKVLSNTASLEEKAQVIDWIDQNDHNREEYETVKLLWMCDRGSKFPESLSDTLVFQPVREEIATGIKAKKRRKTVVMFLAAIIAFGMYIYMSTMTITHDPLVFEREPIVDAVARIERRYEVKIHIDSGVVSSCTFTGTFSEVSVSSDLVSSIANAVGARYEVIRDSEYRLIGGRCQ